MGIRRRGDAEIGDSGKSQIADRKFRIYEYDGKDHTASASNLSSGSFSPRRKESFTKKGKQCILTIRR